MTSYLKPHTATLLWGRGTLMALLLLCGMQAHAQTKSQQIKPGETPAGLETGQWASIQQQVQMGKYKAYPQETGGYTSANLAHGFQIGYAPNGSTHLSPRDCAQADYRIALRLHGIGYDQLTTLDAPAYVTQEDLGKTKGSKVTYQWNKNLREWWVNDEKGLEQWFTLQQAPQGRKADTPLHLRMALHTDMQVTQQSNRLQLQKGNTTLHYDKLKVWDAKGQEIPAQMRHTDGYIDLYISEAKATYPLTIDPVWSQQAYLKASNTGEQDWFGYSVAISAETIVVGAPYEDSNATGINGNQANNSAENSGAAYIFLRSGSAWTQQAYLKGSNTEGGDQFGYSVTISGETVVVGALWEDSNVTGINGNQADNTAVNAGAAYVFVRSGSAWTQQAYLKASNTEAFDEFGISVAISGETVVVGALAEDSNATGINGNQADNNALSSGAAYVFVRSGSTWTQQAYLKASNTGGSDQFGFSVAISGETIVVGANLEASNATGINGDQTNNSATLAGAAYVFVRSGSTWTQQAYLKASNTGGGDNFGRSVAISGETVVVGAPYESSNATGINGDQANNSAPQSGAAYVFVRSGSTWTQQAYLKASNTDPNDDFGISVAISGETVVVGAPYESSNATGINGNQANNSAVFAGAAYVFVRSGSTWTQQAYLKASNTGFGDYFGHSVAISGETIVIGAIGEGSNGDQADNSASVSGATYVFSIANQYRSNGDVNFTAATNWQESPDGSTWTNASNPPDGTANTGPITIRNTHTATVTASTTLDELTVDAGGTLLVNNGTTLSIQNGSGTDLTVNGTATINGVLEFAGGSTGTIATAGAVVNAAGELRLTSGTLTTNGNLMLKSTSETATGVITGGTNASIVGNATIERFLKLNNTATGGGDYKFFSHPLQINILFSAVSGLNANATNVILLHEPAVINNNPGTGWIGAGGATAIMARGRGYAHWITADKTISYTGPPQLSDFTTSTITYTAANAPFDGFNLIGNPFPAVVDLNALTRNNVAATYYVYNHSTDSYWTWTAGAPGIGTGTGNSRYIAPGQAFIVKATSATSPSVTFPASARVSNAATHFRTAQPTRLTLQTAAGLQYQTAVRFGGGATAQYDDEFDALFFPGSQTTTPKFATVAGEHRLTLNSLPELAGNTTVPVYLEIGVNGRYTLNFEEGNLEAGVPVYLADHATGEMIDLRARPTYVFEATTSDRKDRFALHFGARQVVSAEAALADAFFAYPLKGAVGVTITDANLSGEVEVLDLTGRVISAPLRFEQGGTLTVATPQAAAGLYLIRVRTAAGTAVKRVVVE